MKLLKTLRDELEYCGDNAKLTLILRRDGRTVMRVYDKEKGLAFDIYI